MTVKFVDGQDPKDHPLKNCTLDSAMEHVNNIKLGRGVGNPHIDQTVETTIDLEKPPYKRIVNFPLEFKIRKAVADNNGLCICEMQTLMTQFTTGDKVYNKKLKIYGIFRVISGEQHIDVSREEDCIEDRWDSEDMVLAGSVCCCDLLVLMAKGCQCGGK